MTAVRWCHVIGVLVTALIVSCAGLVTVPSVALSRIPVPDATAAVLHGQRLTLDGGALRVRPTPVLPTLSRRRALFDLTHSDAGGAGFEPGRVFYGAVTITARRDDDPNRPGRYPSFHSTPAWVLFFDPGASSCPATLTARASVPVRDRSAMVINARTGAALIYLGVGSGTCVAAGRPSVTKVAEQLSVHWTLADLPAGTTVRAVTAHYPGCSASFSAGGESEPGTLSLLGVEVSRAFGRCRLAGRPVTVSISGFHFLAPLRHAPVGPITTGQPAF